MPKIIVFTGGHHNSALVLALNLRAQNHKIVWIGHKFTMRGDKQLSAEYQEVTGSNIPFYELKTGKFYRVANPFEFLKIVLGFIQSFFYLLSIKPNLIISFGGYLSVPVVIAGWLLRIPSATHEQTVTAGWANKAIAPFVKKYSSPTKARSKTIPKTNPVLLGYPSAPTCLNQPLIVNPNRR